MSRETKAEFLAWLEQQPEVPTPKRKSAQVLEWPKPLSEMELCRRQAVIDATLERLLAERDATKAEAARHCHVGPGDPDWRGHR